jgi:hypothetical protein
MDTGIIILLSILIHFLATDFTFNKGSELTLLTKENYYDIIHHNFKDYSAFHYTKNAITASFILPFLFNLEKTKSIEGQSLLLIPLLIIIRSLFTSVTIFPATRENGPNDDQNQFSFLNYFIGDNYDRMFSGHISFAVVLSYLATKLNLVSLPLIVIANLIHAFVIVVTRSHYTIDVLNSGLITFLLTKSLSL